MESRVCLREKGGSQLVRPPNQGALRGFAWISRGRLNNFLAQPGSFNVFGVIWLSNRFLTGDHRHRIH
jgi:hypothetical protein